MHCISGTIACATCVRLPIIKLKLDMICTKFMLLNISSKFESVNLQTAYNYLNFKFFVNIVYKCRTIEILNY